MYKNTNFNYKKSYLFLRELFYVLTGALVVFAVLEIFWNNVVLSYVDMNWVLIVWLINGILILVINKNREDKKNESST